MNTKVLPILKKHLGLILLLITLVPGLLLFDDYGISWDEPGSHEIGTLNYDYIFKDSKQLLSYPEKDYGIAFELPLVIIEKVLGLHEQRSIYLERHLLTHLFFLFCAYIFFLLIDFLYNNKLLATTGFLMLMLNPLLYAHSFFNSKDIPFMGMFILCFYLSAIAFKSRKTKHFILLGVVSGLLINMRIIGILMTGCGLLFLVFDALYTKPDIRKNIRLFFIFLLTVVTTLYVSWPYLWESPLLNFSLAIQHMSKFTWYYNVLFMGELIPANEVPWNYFPVWFGITTPLPYIVLGLTGILLLLLRFFRSPLRWMKPAKERNNLIYLLCLFAPVSAVIIMGSTLYDSWRHLFFIYPCFILIAVFGLDRLFKTPIRKPLILGLAVTFAFSLLFMIRNHPFQHLYFNPMANARTPEYLRSQFELDYWGTSYKQAYEYLLANDASEEIKVAVENEPGHYNLNLLLAEQARRIHLTDTSEATYFITNYRWHPQNYTEFKNKEWHAIKVEGNSINTIFKLK